MGYTNDSQRQLVLHNRSRGGLKVSALYFGSNVPGSSPGHCVVFVVFLGKTILNPGVKMRTGELVLRYFGQLAKITKKCISGQYIWINRQLYN